MKLKTYRVVVEFGRATTPIEIDVSVHADTPTAKRGDAIVEAIEAHPACVGWSRWKFARKAQ